MREIVFFVGFEEREYYQEKNANRRVRRERVPVRNHCLLFEEKKNAFDLSLSG